MHVCGQKLIHAFVCGYDMQVTNACVWSKADPCICLAVKAAEDVEACLDTVQAAVSLSGWPSIPHAVLQASISIFQVLPNTPAVLLHCFMRTIDGYVRCRVVQHVEGVLMCHMCCVKIASVKQAYCVHCIPSTLCAAAAG